MRERARARQRPNSATAIRGAILGDQLSLGAKDRDIILSLGFVRRYFIKVGEVYLLSRANLSPKGLLYFIWQGITFTKLRIRCAGLAPVQRRGARIMAG